MQLLTLQDMEQYQNFLQFPFPNVTKNIPNNPHVSACKIGNNLFVRLNPLIGLENKSCSAKSK